MANNNSKKKGSMTVAEAGKKGGRTTAQNYGSEFYSRIGKKGGERSHRGSKSKKS